MLSALSWADSTFTPSSGCQELLFQNPLCNSLLIYLSKVQLTPSLLNMQNVQGLWCLFLLLSTPTPKGVCCTLWGIPLCLVPPSERGNMSAISLSHLLYWVKSLCSEQ